VLDILRVAGSLFLQVDGDVAPGPTVALLAGADVSPEFDVSEGDASPPPRKRGRTIEPKEGSKASLTIEDDERLALRLLRGR
jgi:hypothetical protein